VAHAGPSRRRPRDDRGRDGAVGLAARPPVLDWGDDDTLVEPWGPIVWPKEPPATVLKLQRRALWLRDLPRQNVSFCVLLVVATIVRVVALLGYQPGLWYSDSVSYVYDAVANIPGVVRPNGYAFFLKLFQPLHSVLFVVAVQHVMGLAMGTAVYVLLCRYHVPKWLATLAAVPALLSVYAIQLEHWVLSDTLFAALVMLALVLVMWNPRPKLKTWMAIGLILGAATLVREQALPLVVAFGIYGLTRLSRRSIVGVGLMIAAFVAPLGAYAAWYDHDTGSIGITSSTGAFLYGRVSTFADCNVIKLPADEQWLCIDIPVADRMDAEDYVWFAASPLNSKKYASKGPFTKRVNSLATNFAIRAIEAQPLAYLGTVWHDTYETFRLNRDQNSLGQSQNDQLFPGAHPVLIKHLGACSYTTCTKVVERYSGPNPDTRVIQPFAGWIQTYQRYVILPGPVLGMIVLVGLGGLILAWRRFGNPVSLPWLIGIITIVMPAATASYFFRYVVAAIPPLCIAAAFGVQEIVAAAKARRDRHEGLAPLAEPVLERTGYLGDGAQTTEFSGVEPLTRQNGLARSRRSSVLGSRGRPMKHGRPTKFDASGT
jgi:hypothetical protein